MFSGKEIKIGEETYILPPISLGMLRHGLTDLFEKHDKLSQEGKHWEATLIRGGLVLQALRRNYPDFSEDKFFDNVDINTLGPLWLYILGASGS